jgi:hypothetical protein
MAGGWSTWPRVLVGYLEEGERMSKEPKMQRQSPEKVPNVIYGFEESNLLPPHLVHSKTFMP